MDTKIITYNSQYKSDFIRLNTAWLEEFFYVEPHDIATFQDIEKDIIENGGEIFFCLVNNEIAGTVAMIKVKETVYEMAKMAVDKKFQGKKLSPLLMEACIAFAKEKKLEKIMLMSSTKLNIALNLYRKYHFVEVPLEETDYERADIQMELIL